MVHEFHGGINVPPCVVKEVLCTAQIVNETAPHSLVSMK